MLAISKTVIAQFGQTQLSMAVCAALEFRQDKIQNATGWKVLDAKKRIVAEWCAAFPHQSSAMFDKATTYGRQLFENVPFSTRMESECATATGAVADLDLAFDMSMVALRVFVESQLAIGGYGKGYDEISRWATGKIPKAQADAAVAQLQKERDAKAAAESAARVDLKAEQAAKDEQSKLLQAAAEKIVAATMPKAEAPKAEATPKAEPVAPREPAITVGLAAPVMLVAFSRSGKADYSLEVDNETTAEELADLILSLQNEHARMLSVVATPEPVSTPKPSRKRQPKQAVAA